MADEITATYTVRIHPDSDGLWADVVELPGCFASGSTYEELWRSLEEGIGLYLSRDDHEVVVQVVKKEEIIEESREFRVLCKA